MENFDSNYFEKLCADPQQRNANLWEWGLLPREGEMMCICGADLKMCRESSTIDGNIWRCHKKVSCNEQKARKCNYRKCFRHGTIFQNSRLPIWKILSFVHLWLTHMNNKEMPKNLEISSTAATNWGSWCYKVVLSGIMSEKVKFGGPGRTVEIDESKFGKRKYHRGHKVEGQWVFGGIERETGRVFMVPVEDRTRKTLLEIIKEWILLETTIISDCWKAYDILEDEGYIHLKMNHKLNFVDPITGAHTNSIESSWRHAKRRLPEYSRKKHLYASYLACYMFQKQCKAAKTCPTREFFRYAANYIGNLTACSEDPGLVEHDFEHEEDEVNCAKKAKYNGEGVLKDVQDEEGEIEYIEEEGDSQYSEEEGEIEYIDGEGDIQYLEEEGEEYLEVEYLEDEDNV